MTPGDVIGGRFELLAEAGSGGMGTVYRARDRESGEFVALKVLRRDGEPDVERFVREAQVLAELAHPGVVRYVAHGATPSGDLYLAMEWLQGEDLAQRLERQGMTVPEALELGARAADALAFVHARGTVHRDIKPSNFFLPNGSIDEVKLLDFGVARTIATARAQTRSGVLLGTPAYMAPEQARGGQAVDARADLFSLGCVLFECLTGRAVFVAEHVMAVLAKILFEDAPRVRELRPDVPDAIDELVARMLSKDPRDRPDDAGSVAVALRALGQGPMPPSQRSPAQPKLLAITTGEQRLISVVVGEPDARVFDDDQTLTPAQLNVDAERLRAAVQPFGGKLEPLANGSVVVTMMARSGGSAAASSATDQATQAARCALAMRALAPDLRIALATGRAVVEDRWPVGEVIDRVARLIREPRPRVIGEVGAPSVRIDDVTAGLLDRRFELSGTADARELLGEHAEADESRPLLGKPTPCVGRERELATLEAVFDECVAESLAHAVLITAPAGVGKSRVRHEFVRRLASRGDVQNEVWVARGDVMSAGSPFGVLGQLIRRTLTGADPDTRRASLRARAAATVPSGDVERVTEFLGELIGLRTPDEASPQLHAARQDAMLMGDQMRRAFEDFVAGACAEHPLVIILEDLQFGDLPTLKFVDAALRNVRDRALMVIAIARPEFKTMFPDVWPNGGGTLRSITEMRLSDLPRRASEKLVAQILPDASPDVVAHLVSQSSGNALYLEELIRAHAERTVAGTRDQAPATVLAMVQSRLERLEPEARRVLRAASVFGEVFSSEGVTALLGGEASRGRAATPRTSGAVVDWLRTLVEREVVVRRGARLTDYPAVSSSTTAPEGARRAEPEYAFRHALLREAAYGMLTDEDRVLGHRLAGDWLERSSAEDAAVLAEHLERGGEGARAAQWYRRAAEQALEGNDLTSAIAHAERGVVCGASGELLGALRAIQAEAHKWRGEFVLGDARGREAMTLLPRGGARWYSALSEVVSCSDRLGRNDALEALAREVLELRQRSELDEPHALASARLAGHLMEAGRYELADQLIAVFDELVARGTAVGPAVQARECQARANRAVLDGHVDLYRQAQSDAYEKFVQIGDVRRAANQRLVHGYACLLLGDYALAESTLRASHTECERLGLRGPAVAALHNLGLALLRLGRIDEARDAERAAIEAFRGHGDRRMEGASRMYLAAILAAEGKLEDAEREADAAIELAAVAPTIQALAYATRSAIVLQRGRAGDALTTATRALELLSTLGKLEEGESMIRLAHAEALLATGDAQRGALALQHAHERLLARAAKIVDPAMRAMFLTQIPENSRTIELAEAAR